MALPPTKEQELEQLIRLYELGIVSRKAVCEKFGISDPFLMQELAVQELLGLPPEKEEVLEEESPDMDWPISNSYKWTILDI